MREENAYLCPLLEDEGENEDEEECRVGPGPLVGQDNASEGEDADNQSHQRHNVAPAKAGFLLFVAGSDGCAYKPWLARGGPKYSFLHSIRVLSISRANQKRRFGA
jgi:hypothetical protein